MKSPSDSASRLLSVTGHSEFFQHSPSPAHAPAARLPLHKFERREDPIGSPGIGNWEHTFEIITGRQ